MRGGLRHLSLFILASSDLPLGFASKGDGREIQKRVTAEMTFSAAANKVDLFLVLFYIGHLLGELQHHAFIA